MTGFSLVAVKVGFLRSRDGENGTEALRGT